MLLRLPPDVARHILLMLDPEEVLAVSGCSKEHSALADGVWDAFIQRVLAAHPWLVPPPAAPARRRRTSGSDARLLFRLREAAKLRFPDEDARHRIPSLVAPSMHPSIHEDGALPWMEVSDDGLTSYIRDEVPGVDTHGYDGYAEIAVPRALGSVRLTVNIPTPDDFCHGVYLRRGHQLEMDLDLGGESSNNATVAGDYCVELLASSTRRSARLRRPRANSWPAAKRNVRVWNPRSKRPQSFTLPDEWCEGCSEEGCAACNLFLQVYLFRRGAQARLCKVELL